MSDNAYIDLRSQRKDMSIYSIVHKRYAYTLRTCIIDIVFVNNISLQRLCYLHNTCIKIGKQTDRQKDRYIDRCVDMC